MGRVQGISTETGQYIYGDTEMAGVYSTDAQSVGVRSHFHRGARIWCYSQRHRAIYDVTAEKG